VISPVSLPSRPFCWPPASAQKSPLKVVCGLFHRYDEGGWGPGFKASLAPEVAVVNLALNGRSTRSFRDEGHWGPALAGKPDYILIQFDTTTSPARVPTARRTPKPPTARTWPAYVDEARSAGAIPVLVTSIVRRNFQNARR